MRVKRRCIASLEVAHNPVRAKGSAPMAERLMQDRWVAKRQTVADAMEAHATTIDRAHMSARRRLHGFCPSRGEPGSLQLSVLRAMPRRNSEAIAQASSLGPPRGCNTRFKRAGSATYQAKRHARFARGRGRALRCSRSRCRARSAHRAPTIYCGAAGVYANRERPPRPFGGGSRPAADAKPGTNRRMRLASGLPSY